MTQFRLSPPRRDPRGNSGLRVRLAVLILFLALTFGVSAASGQAGSQDVLWLPLVSTAPRVTNPIQQGIATYYNATGGGACGFDPSPQDLNVAAMNAAQYDASAVCGEYVQVTGPKGTVTVRIVDLCPGCGTGQLDLSEQAFAAIADLVQGVVPISWQLASPDIPGPIAYHFSSGSSQWWTAVQVRNIRNPVSRLEYQNEQDAWVDVPRTNYNYFVPTSSGIGPGPYSFRVTDLYGNQLVDSGIPLTPGGTVPGGAQFPPGP